MTASRVWRAPLPRSLRRQFLLTVAALWLLAVAGSLTAISALRNSVTAVRELSEERLAQMQAAHDLVQRTLLVERRMSQMLTAGSFERVAADHEALIQQLGEVDRLVARLGSVNEDVSVLEIHQAGQLFRNTSHIVATLRADALRAQATFAQALQSHTTALLETQDPAAVTMAVTLFRLRDTDDLREISGLREQFVRQATRVARLPRIVEDDLRAEREAGVDIDAQLTGSLFDQRRWRVGRDEALKRFGGELERQVVAMVDAAERSSAYLTRAYRDAVQRLDDESQTRERWVWSLLVVSLLIAWLVYRVVLGRHVLDRLQDVSLRLRGGALPHEGSLASVQGDDEIGEMARSVERYLEDHARLEEANQELEDFSYSISHDLQIPLRAIDGFSQIVLRDHGEKLDGEGRRLLGVVRSNTRRMGHLIDQMLEFARLGRIELRPSEVDMARLARETMEELRPVESGGRLELRAENVPPVAGDLSMLRHVLANLISNAIKFTRDKETPRIEFGGSVRGDEAVYYVKDNGVGFDMKYVGKLFGLSQRLHSAEDFEGTGIGLAIVRRIIVRHGGRVWAEGRVNEGATIYFALPRGDQIAGRVRT